MGNGEVSGFIGVLPEDFGLEAYTECYVSVKDAKALTAFTSQYDAKVEKVQENIEEIAKVDGIDGIFVGPYDLSVAMGIPTQFDKPEFKAALERILKAVKDAGKFTIIYCADFNVANTRLKQGFDSVTVGQDVNFYIDAINAMVHSIER